MSQAAVLEKIEKKAEKAPEKPRTNPETDRQDGTKGATACAAETYAAPIPKTAEEMVKAVFAFIGMLQVSPDAKVVDLSYGNQPRESVALTRYKPMDQQTVRIEFIIPR
jgi:hypothetical protein